MIRRLSLGLMGLLLAACATLAPPATVPLLKLSPASLGRELMMAQQLQVQAGDKTITMDVALEADADAVRMAVLQFGRTLARLEWDGRELKRTLGPGWTDAELADRVLSDLQLVWWPAPAIRAALPVGWSLTDTLSSRTLAYQGRAVIAITLPRPGSIVIDHVLEGYSVRVQTEDQSPIFEIKT